MRRPAEFASALERCAEAGKPVVCLKVGRSQAAARAALAHTGAVVGSERAFSALLRRYGAVEVDDFTALVETLEVLGRARRPRGKRIAAISESGGEGALLADQGEAAGIPFEPLPEAVAAELTARFPNYGAPGNPLDAWAIDEAEAVFPGSIEVLVGSGAFDIVIAQADQSQFRGAEEHEWCFMIVKALAEATAGTDIFPAVTTVSAVDPRPEVAEYALEHDVALLRGPRDAMRALAAAASLRPASATARARAPVELADLLQEGPLPEFESALVLERYGVPLAPRRRAASPEEAAEAAAELGFPVVVKVDGPAHKAAQNGVVLGLGDEDGVRSATQRLGGRVLVASQAEGGAEAFCGMTRDPDFGPVLAVGLGGRAVESLSLAAVSLAPLGEEEARQLVAEAPGLETSPAAQEALAATLVALGRLAVDHPRIAAVDVNPLILSADGAVAVDALVVVEGESSRVSDVVLYERRGPAAWVTLNRPSKLNAISGEVVRRLRESWREAAEDEDVKVVVLTGAGRAFSAGYDIAEEVEQQIESAERWHEVLAEDVDLTMELWSLPKPTIAAVRGWCLAGACELAMACDLVVAADDAQFGEPEIRYGSGPVTLLMPFVLGQKKTNELLFTGDAISATEAERLGLVNAVVAPDALEDAVNALVAKIAPTPLPVLRLTKLALVRAQEAMGLRTAVAANLDISAMLNAADTPEQQEFDRIAAEQGLKAALAWRDSRYGEGLA